MTGENPREKNLREIREIIANDARTKYLSCPGCGRKILANRKKRFCKRCGDKKEKKDHGLTDMHKVHRDSKPDSPDEG